MGPAGTAGRGHRGHGHGRRALLPTEGLAGLASRTALWLALPALLLATGFFTAAERLRLRAMLSPSAVRARLAALSAVPAGEPESELAAGYAPEVYEAVRRDEDRL